MVVEFDPSATRIYFEMQKARTYDGRPRQTVELVHDACSTFIRPARSRQVNIQLRHVFQTIILL